MRIWSIHPRYLDTKGLVALWRESLLAQAVLLGNTQGYKHHPQLRRFQLQSDPIQAIANYLHEIHAEATQRNYRFQKERIALSSEHMPLMPVTQGQINYEWRWFLEKMKLRSPSVFEKYNALLSPDPHPLFCVVDGAVEIWENTHNI